MRASESRPSDVAQGSANGHGDVVPNGRLGLKEEGMKDASLRRVGVPYVGQSTVGEREVKQVAPRRCDDVWVVCLCVFFVCVCVCVCA